MICLLSCSKPIVASLRFQDFLLDEDDEEEEEEEAGGSAAGRDYQVKPLPVQAA